jgi:uncharacterized protein with HEPN domain
MLLAADDSKRFVTIKRESYEGAEGMVYRRAIKNDVYEFCESAEKLTGAFEKANGELPPRVAKMRFDLAHDYPEVQTSELIEFAREVMPKVARLLRNAKFPAKPAVTDE